MEPMESIISILTLGKRWIWGHHWRSRWYNKQTQWDGLLLPGKKLVTCVHKATPSRNNLRSVEWYALSRLHVWSQFQSMVRSWRAILWDNWTGRVHWATKTSGVEDLTSVKINSLKRKKSFWIWHFRQQQSNKTLTSHKQYTVRAYTDENTQILFRFQALLPQALKRVISMCVLLTGTPRQCILLRTALEHSSHKTNTLYYSRPKLKSGTQTPPREYYAWWSQEILSVCQLDHKKDICG
jgi:hypothetical protein